MVKMALLIGVGDYTELTPLPSPPRDVEALKQVLQHSEMGAFDRVKTLIDPNFQEMSVAIETCFSECNADDVVLIYFSGHGVKNRHRDLYFAASNTRKDQEDILQATAVSAGFVRGCLRNSRAKRQVMILDCCFSGAFGDLLPKDSGEIDLKQQLGAEGWVVLTSSSSLQYSFEQKEAQLSIYTRFLVEGIRTGAADGDADGCITVDELHQYVSNKVHDIAPEVMSPKIIVLRDEGFRIPLARAPVNDPMLKYRQEVERWVEGGKIPITAHQRLNNVQDRLGISPETAAAIELEVLRPYSEYPPPRPPVIPPDPPPLNPRSWPNWLWDDTQLGWRLWLQWVLATAISQVVAIAIFGTVILNRYTGVQEWLIVGAGIGGIEGLMQWFLLRRRLPIAWWWIVATSLGWAIGYCLAWVLTGIVGRDVSTALYWVEIGTATGFAQWWFTLQKQRHSATQWILATIGGAIVASIAAGVIDNAILQRFVTGTVRGAITGAVLIRLLELLSSRDMKRSS